MTAAALCTAALVLVGLFAVHRLLPLLHLVIGARRQEPHGPVATDGTPALRVTVQVPLFNEPTVAARVIRAAASLTWPSDRFELQILDDSTDGSAAANAALVDDLRRRGLVAHHLTRAHRDGYKAGALAAGLKTATGDVVAIFDADFVPPSDFLTRTVPLLAAGADLVQARWGHLPAARSVLDGGQRALLDAHFAIDQRGRAAAGRFFGFNGTAGVWRRCAIERAGGWDGASLAEDLDLSVRAHLAGCRFVYLDDVVVPAELPDTMAAFMRQQARWVRGSAQTARLRGAQIWRSARPIVDKVDVTLRLLQNAAYLCMAVFVATLPFAVLEQSRTDGSTRFMGGWLWLLGVPLLAMAGDARGRAWQRPGHLGAAMLLGTGLSLNNARAFLAGLVLGPAPFERTPKRGTAARAALGQARGAGIAELALGTLHLVTSIALLRAGELGLSSALWMPAASLLYVGVTARASGASPWVRWLRLRRSIAMPTARAAQHTARGHSHAGSGPNAGP